METLEIKKLSQAITNIKNKMKFCSSRAVEGLNEDEIDGLSRILSECCDELEQAANSIDLLTPNAYTMQRKGHALRAVPMPFVQKMHSVTTEAQEQHPA